MPDEMTGETQTFVPRVEAFGAIFYDGNNKNAVKDLLGAKWFGVQIHLCQHVGEFVWDNGSFVSFATPEEMGAKYKRVEERWGLYDKKHRDWAIGSLNQWSKVPTYPYPSKEAAENDKPYERAGVIDALSKLIEVED